MRDPYLDDITIAAQVLDEEGYPELGAAVRVLVGEHQALRRRLVVDEAYPLPADLLAERYQLRIPPSRRSTPRNPDRGVPAP